MLVYYILYSCNISFSGEDWVKKSLKSKTSTNASGLKKQAKIQMAKALEEDPTVFQVNKNEIKQILCDLSQV